ncbi:GNAT family N-acetyltransferase, partial [Streptomyces sp. NPDC059373]
LLPPRPTPSPPPSPSRSQAPDHAPSPTEIHRPDPAPDQVIATVVAEDIRTGHGVGTANLKFFDGIPEVKRLYIAPTHRGQGVGAAVLATLERIALRRGADRLILSTGPLQPDAVRLYEKTGWTPIPPFGPAKRFPGGFFQKAL